LLKKRGQMLPLNGQEPRWQRIAMLAEDSTRVRTPRCASGQLLSGWWGLACAAIGVRVAAGQEIRDV
jgi:hypothetical protein